ncbi:hypothetical protein NMY22_g14999 [Coprinellus aureogranulatus]|nr:hypothetical protein NMY22_g14999 [Coprinellus aureogranulatus]
MKNLTLPRVHQRLCSAYLDLAKLTLEVLLSGDKDGRTSVSMAMPLDVVYKTLSHLSQRLRSEKSWRKILFSTQTASVRKTARMGVRVICPEPPEGVTKQTWATFLFGMANIRQNLGKRSSCHDNRNWLMVRRICSGLPYIRNLTLTSIVDGGWDYNRSKEYYWDDEIKQAAAQRVPRAATASSSKNLSSAFSKVTASAFSERPLEFVLLVLLGLICTELALEHGPLSFVSPKVAHLIQVIIGGNKRDVSLLQRREEGYNVSDLIDIRAHCTLLSIEGPVAGLCLMCSSAADFLALRMLGFSHIDHSLKKVAPAYIPSVPRTRGPSNGVERGWIRRPYISAFPRNCASPLIYRLAIAPPFPPTLLSLPTWRSPGSIRYFRTEPILIGIRRCKLDTPGSHKIAFSMEATLTDFTIDGTLLLNQILDPQHATTLYHRLEGVSTLAIKRMSACAWRLDDEALETLFDFIASLPSLEHLTFEDFVLQTPQRPPMNVPIAKLQVSQVTIVKTHLTSLSFLLDIVQPRTLTLDGCYFIDRLPKCDHLILKRIQSFDGFADILVQWSGLKLDIESCPFLNEGFIRNLQRHMFDAGEGLWPDAEVTFFGNPYAVRRRIHQFLDIRERL